MPSSEYTQAQFQADLEELTSLISGYSSSGGGSHKSHKSNKKSGGARERKLDAEGNPLRSFRVVNIDGRNMSNNKEYAIRYYHGTKKNNTPGKAAEHAFSKICRHSGQTNKNKCKVSFTLLETTKGSAHKTYGPYVGKFVKLVEPRKITRKDPKTGKVSSYMVHFKPYVVHSGEK